MLAWIVCLVPAAARVPAAAAAPPAALPARPPPPALDWKDGAYVKPTVPEGTGFTPKDLPPHPVILILVDALRADHLGVYGYPRDTTPNLDAFAKDGITFSTFYVNAPWTRPSTTTILTGLHPSRHRVQCEQHRLDPRYVTLPEALKEAGYVTAGVVGNGNGASIAGLDQGFDHYEDPKDFGGLPNARQVFDRDLAWLKKHAKDERFFLFTFVVDPHDPYHGPNAAAEARWLWKGHPKIVRVPRWEYPKGQGLTHAQRRAVEAVYDSAVRYTDAELGRFFEGLERLGLWDTATIVITADHGDGFGEHGFYKHAHHLWDEVERVPFIVRSPLIPEAARGTRVDVPAQSLDIYPTLVHLAGADLPTRKRPGLDLFGLAARPSAAPARTLYAEYNCFGISRWMARTPKWKLILQLPANEAEFMSTVTRKDLLPSVVFDHEELKGYRVDRDPLERTELVPGRDPAKVPEDAAPILKALRRHIDAQPGGRARLIQEMDPATEENLRALGYIQ